MACKGMRTGITGGKSLSGNGRFVVLGDRNGVPATHQLHPFYRWHQLE